MHIPHHRRAAAALALAALSATRPAHAAANLLPGAIQPGSIHIDLAPVASGFIAPTFATAAPGNSADLFIVDQPGKISILRNGALLPTPFLDLTGLTATQPLSAGYDERGLLSVAFDPGFANPAAPGYRTLYTYAAERTGTAPADFAPIAGTVTTGINHQNVLTQWKVSAANPSVVDLSTRKDLLREDHPALNHNGGTVAFGPDGFLYLAIGDGGTANDSGNGHIAATGNAQVLNNIMGKVLRLDPYGTNSANGKYGIPAANPFISTPSALPEIYAYGFRNPYKYSFDAGRLLVADVGQNNVEELDVVTAGGNYGWAVKEGTFLFNRSNGTVDPTNSPGSPAGLIDPILEYDHNAGTAIVGGFVYHGSLLPGLQGKYVFGDFSNSPFSGPANGRLFYSDLASGLISEFNLNAPLGLWLKGFGQDASGELYVLASTNLGPSGTTGVVLRVVPEPCTLGFFALAAGLLIRRRR